MFYKRIRSFDDYQNFNWANSSYIEKHQKQLKDLLSPERKSPYYKGISLQTFEKVDFRSRNIKNFEDLEKNSVDLYSAVKSLYLQRRENLINNGSTSDDEWKDFK